MSAEDTTKETGPDQEKVDKERLKLTQAINIIRQANEEHGRVPGDEEYFRILEKQVNVVYDSLEELAELGIPEEHLYLDEQERKDFVTAAGNVHKHKERQDGRIF